MHVLRFLLLNKHSFSISLRLFMFICHALAGCSCQWRIQAFGSGCSSTPLSFQIQKLLLLLINCQRTLWIQILPSFWLLSKHSVSISMRGCSCIGHPLAGCTCFCCSGCSVSSPLPFLSVFDCLLAIPAIAGCACFCASGWSIRSDYWATRREKISTTSWRRANKQARMEPLKECLLTNQKMKSS